MEKKRKFLENPKEKNTELENLKIIHKETGFVPGNQEMINISSPDKSQLRKEALLLLQKQIRYEITLLNEKQVFFNKLDNSILQNNDKDNFFHFHH